MTTNVAPIVAAGNLWKLSRLRVVLERAQVSGVPILVLKGAAILGWLYSLEERPMADVDVLIRPEDRERFVSALAPEGRVKVASSRGILPGYKRGQFSMEFLGLSLDVHVHILESPWLRDLVPIDERRLWREVSRGDVAGRSALRLSAEDQLLHFAAHTVFHHSAEHGGPWGQAHEDGRRLLERRQIDWARLVRIATSQRMRLATWLYLADRAIVDLVPARVLASLRPTRAALLRVAASRRLAAASDRSLAPVLLTDDPFGPVRVLGLIVRPEGWWLDRVYARTPRVLRALRHAAVVVTYGAGRVATMKAPAHRKTPSPKRAHTGWEPMPMHAKVSLVVKIWFWFAVVHLRLRTGTLPQVVQRLRSAHVVSSRPMSPVRIGRVTARALGITGRRPRCLVTALVHYRLLTEQGEPAQLVIGLPPDALSPDAHAWIEIRGVDVGPPPGRGPHVPLARYG
jgi:hypothetical protein